MKRILRCLLTCALMLTILLTTQCNAPQETTPSPVIPPAEEQEPAVPTPPENVAAADEEKRMPATCFNGFRDGEESDADCGGSCSPCGYGKQCKETSDCVQSLLCDYRSKRCLQRRY